MYTDAETSTREVASLVIFNKPQTKLDALGGLRGAISSPKWEEAFKEETYIYGIEMLATVAIALSLGEPMGNRDINFHIDHINARGAILTGGADSPDIDIPIRMFRTRIHSLGALDWFELIASGANPSDAPTRFAPLPIPSRRSKKSVAR